MRFEAQSVHFERETLNTEPGFWPMALCRLRRLGRHKKELKTNQGSKKPDSEWLRLQVRRVRSRRGLRVLPGFGCLRGV